MWTGYRADEDTTDSITMLLLLGALVPLLRTMTAEIVSALKKALSTRATKLGIITIKIIKVK